jgi:hypothetical protein
MAARKKRPPMSPADVVAAILVSEASEHSKIRYMFWSVDARDAATRTALRPIFGLGMSRNRSRPKWTKSLVFDLETCGIGDTRRNRQLAKNLVTSIERDDVTLGKPGTLNHTIFEGTSEIQQLVIARAISGLRIE